MTHDPRLAVLRDLTRGDRNDLWWLHILEKLDAVDPARAMLRECAAQFEFYAELHLAKSPPDIAKAGTNREFAERCRAALALAEDGR